MSQRVGRIFVKVKDPKDWEKLFDLEIRDSYWLNAKTGKDLFDISGDTFIIDSEWSPEFPDSWSVYWNGLGEFAHKIYSRIQDCCILADLTNINTDPVYRLYYSFSHNTELKTKTIRRPAGKVPEIYDIEGWIRWGNIKLQPCDWNSMYRWNDDCFSFIRRTAPAKMLTGVAIDQQKRGRLLISVKDPALWEKAKELDFSDADYGLNISASELFNGITGCDFVLEQQWHPVYATYTSDAVWKMLRTLYKALGENNCVILADTADPMVSPCFTCYYLVNGKLEKNTLAKSMESLDIRDVEQWLEMVELKLTDKRLGYLRQFQSPLFDFTRK